MIVQLNNETQGNFAQHGLKGHIIVYPQNTCVITKVLPPSIEDIVSPICVVFVAPTMPSQEWLIQDMRPLAIRGNKVRAALIWLKVHNKDIEIDENVLNVLESNLTLLYKVQHLKDGSHLKSLTSHYDATWNK